MNAMAHKSNPYKKATTVVSFSCVYVYYVYDIKCEYTLSCFFNVCISSNEYCRNGAQVEPVQEGRRAYGRTETCHGPQFTDMAGCQKWAKAFYL